MDNLLERMQETLDRFKNNLNDIKSNLETSKKQVLLPFSKAEELRQKQLRLADVNRLLSTSNDSTNKINQDISENTNKNTILDSGINFNLFKSTYSTNLDEIVI